MKRKGNLLLSTLVGTVAGVATGVATVKTLKSKGIGTNDGVAVKLKEFYDVLVQWVSLKQEGKSLASYFEENNYKTVAIYGMKELGERLYDELRNSDIEVKYIIDKNADAIYSEIDVITPDEKLPKVDVIVVTAIHYYDEIEEMLTEKVNYPVVSLEDIVFEL